MLSLLGFLEGEIQIKMSQNAMFFRGFGGLPLIPLKGLLYEKKVHSVALLA